MLHFRMMKKFDTLYFAVLVKDFWKDYIRDLLIIVRLLHEAK